MFPIEEVLPGHPARDVRCGLEKPRVFGVVQTERHVPLYGMSPVTRPAEIHCDPWGAVTSKTEKGFAMHSHVAFVVIENHLCEGDGYFIQRRQRISLACHALCGLELFSNVHGIHKIHE